MDKIPLIPKSSNVASIDVSPVIGDVFQCAGEPTFENKVAHNVDKYRVENHNLKESSAKVIGIFNDAKLSMEDIGLVEKSLMVRQGACMNEKFYLSQDKIVSEHLKLKRKEVLLDLYPNEVEKYGLLQKNDIKPIKPERSMDFRINSNQHLCAICPSNESLLKPLPKKKVSLIPIRRPRNIPPKKIPEVVFVAEPNQIVFYNFELDITYEQTFKLRNVSRKHQSFLPSLLRKDSIFKVALHPNSNTRLAPGMCAVFSVTFKIDIFKNRKETIAFRSQSASVTTVAIICYREPPDVRVYVCIDVDHFIKKTDLVLIDGHKVGRCVALNSTIDCGSCFVGNTQIVTLIFHNRGSAGNFFFVTEEDWYTNIIQSISADMTVELPHFTVFPSFFRIEEDHTIEVTVKFSPTKFGVEVEKFFLLCDNNAFQDIEIIADGVIFDENSIVINADMLIYENVTFSEFRQTSSADDIIMEPPNPHAIDFGNCLARVAKTRYITVHNNAAVNLYYKWVIKYSDELKDGSEIKQMDSDMVTIDKVTDYLPANSTTMFPVILLMNSEKLGYFGLVLIFYVLDVPERAIMENTCVWVAEESRSSSCLETEGEVKRLNLAIAQVKLLCKMTELEVNFNPRDAITSTHLPADRQFEQVIEICSNCNVPLECAWQPPRKCAISIEPATFTMEPGVTFSCTLRVYLKNTKTIRDTLKLQIHGGSYERSFRVKIKVFKPMARFSEEILNFGYVCKQARKIEHKLYIKNTGYEKLKWKIFEMRYDTKYQIIKILRAPRHLSARKGVLGRRETFPITYKATTVLQRNSWVSCLILFSSMPKKAVALDTCLVIYKLNQPTITIKTDNMFKTPILCPEEVMYLNVPEKFEVNLYNSHDEVIGVYIWGHPMGKQSKQLEVQFEPKRGLVPSNTAVPVTLIITPLETGNVENFFLPCFVGNASKPILLTIMCAVDNIHLNIYLPAGDNFIKVSWPLEIITSLSQPDLSGGEEQIETEECQNLPEEEETLRSINVSSSLSLCSSMESIVKYTAEGMREGSEEEYHGSVTDDWKNMISFKESKSITLPPLPLFMPLKNAFGTEVFLHDYVIEFRQVPLKTPTMKSIIIENLTPVMGRFSIECSNFYGTDEYEDDKNSTHLLYKLNIIKKDTWEDIIEGERGLVIKISPLNGVITGRQVMEIDIWVYANTWGTYMEEVKFEINDLMPFCFNVLVEVVGVPIEFPMACNTIRSSPVLRFGNIPYLSDPITRKIVVKNTSCIPINLGWHVFLCKPKSPKWKCSARNPFNVVMDTIENPAGPFSVASQETDFKLMVTPVNYGKEDDKIFQISPRDLQLNPKSSGILTVIVNPQLFQPQFNKTFIEARLIGHLHLTKKYSFESNLYNRLSGTDIAPAKVKLLATIEMPLLRVELVKGETRIKAYANDIIAAQKIIFEGILVFKNFDTAPIMIYMHTSKPFKVIHLHTKTNPKKTLDAAEVLPQECVEVLIRCTIDGEAVYQYSNMLYNEKESVFTEVPNFAQQSLTLRRSLNIHQYGLQQQITNLELVLYYPKLTVSHESIDFGFVFVGGTKKSLLTLTNPTGSHVPFNIQSNSAHFLNIVPSFGSVPRAIGITPSTFVISLYFMPKECLVFQDTLKVITNMPLYNFSVNVMGTGSNNEKFFNDGL